MRFDEIGLKDLVLDFDSNDLQDITIVQGDTKTRGFKVLVSTNNGEIIKASSQYEMRLYGINSNYPDKSFFTKGVIDGDFYKVYISTDMASASGKLQLQLALFEGKNALIQSRIKEVDVYNSIANGGTIGKDLLVDFGKLQDALDMAEKQQKKFDESLIRQESIESDVNKKHTEVVQIRDGLKDVLSTENARVEAEKKRVSAENTRTSQESTRQSNEHTRKSNETERQQNESTRESNETQRQSNETTRKTEEQKRISAETKRDSAEKNRNTLERQRQSNEDKRIYAENLRKMNDVAYKKNEEQRQAQENVRQKQENERVEAEKLRQSQEDTRKQSEDTRVSQESTRQSQEQSRVDAESKRETSETSRRKSEQLRNTNEHSRKNNEQERATQEDTRKKQETDRVEAEKQRVKAESDRAGKFAGWDKTMQGVIPTATNTTAGIVKIDVDGETVAASKKTVDENVKALYEAYGSTLNDINTMNTETNIKIDEKADKKHTHSISDITDLQTTLNKKLETKDITELSKKIDTNTTEISNTKKIANAKSNSISGLVNAFDNKADKADLDKKADKYHNHEIYNIANLKETLDKKTDKNVVEELDERVEFYAKSLFEITAKQATKTDISNLKSKVNKNQIPRLKIGEDTSKIPNDSYYIETDEVELKKYLSEEKIIFIGDRDWIDPGNFSKLIDLKGQKLTKKQDDFYELNVLSNSIDPKVAFRENYNSLKAQEKDFSNHIIILGIQEDYYPFTFIYFEIIKKITGSRKIIDVFDPIFKSKVTQESYEDYIGMMEMIVENPDYLVGNAKLLRGGNMVRYKDKNGVIH